MTLQKAYRYVSKLIKVAVRHNIKVTDPKLAEHLTDHDLIEAHKTIVNNVTNRR